MFGYKPKKDELLNHWIAFAEDFNISPQEFYTAIEKGLVDRRIPGLEISRVDYAEGGALSDNRVYLRMIRERLAFDACAASCGSGYFFSCRSVHSPVIVRLWHVLTLIGLLSGIYYLLIKYLGFIWSGVAVAGFVLAMVQVFRNTIAMGLSDLDALFIKSPIIGPVYEGWFRRETYYRHDTRLLYLEAVPRLIKELADEVTGAKGVKLECQYQLAPPLGAFYQPVREKAHRGE